MTGRPKGYKVSQETKAKTRATITATLKEKRTRNPLVEWMDRQGWKLFGDRLDFLAEESQHLETGKLRILPAKERHGKDEEAA